MIVFGSTSDADTYRTEIVDEPMAQLHETANTGDCETTAPHGTQDHFKTTRKKEGDSLKSNYSGRRRRKETVFEHRKVALAKFLEVALKFVLFPIHKASFCLSSSSWKT